MIKKLQLLLISSFLPFIGFAAENGEQSIDDRINAFMAPITDVIARIVFSSFTFEINGEAVNVPIVLVWLVGGALFFTLYFKFPNIRFFKLAINVVRGKYSNPEHKGEVSHFQALTAALSGTVGLGNIAGVAIAISMGGPGATFWMIIAGLLGMSSKFTECTLGVRYRDMDAKGRVFGGPMRYLSKGFADLKMKIGERTQSYAKIGKVLAVFFAIACIGGSFGGGNMFQVNQAFKQLSGMPFIQGSWLAENGWFFGVVMAVLVAIVIIGGIKSIAKVTDKIVPFMCLVYVLAALVVIFYHYDAIPHAGKEILVGAFNPAAISGGMVGVLIQGFRRAAFSNEAGIGSASIAHSAVRTKYPASEGIVALLEPFIDTVVVCTMTALVIVITGMDDVFRTEYAGAAFDANELGVSLTSRAFESVISWFPYILAIAVFLFAFSTMISWSYYGMQSWAYLFGHSKKADYSYKLIFCIFVVIGAAMTLGSVTDFSDCMIFLMCFPNIFGLVFLAPVVKNELNSYVGKIRSGEIKSYK